MWTNLLWLALAGAAGTLARYGLQGLVQSATGASFPWGTFAVNALGCFVFGIVWALGGERAILSPGVRSVILVGFMGAFTTFSSLAAESGRLLGDAEWALGLGNVLLHNVTGIGLFYAGLAFGRWV